MSSWAGNVSAIFKGNILFCIPSNVHLLGHTCKDMFNIAKKYIKKKKKCVCTKKSIPKSVHVRINIHCQLQKKNPCTLYFFLDDIIV